MKDLLHTTWDTILKNREILASLLGIQILLGIIIMFMIAWEEDPDKL